MLDEGTPSPNERSSSPPASRQPRGTAEVPLGLMPGMSYEEKETILHSGEAALLYGDGLVEAHDPEGDMFGFPRLQALVAEHGEERSLEDSYRIRVNDTRYLMAPPPGATSGSW
jgi:serine phosphatase RsbU (regulator of sigma subunit)